jgi:hypothetical protein
MAAGKEPATVIFDRKGETDVETKRGLSTDSADSKNSFVRFE